MHIKVSLPDWAQQEFASLDQPIVSIEDRMRLAIRCSRQNFQNQTGGPFAAAVFREDTWQLVALGVNRVVPAHCSSAHAEVVALSLAQNRLQTFDLGGPNSPPHQLVVNWRPCAMCYGAVVWSGVRSLVIAGSDSQLEQITGFDEGPIHPQWREELDARGIALTEDILKSDAIEVFREFRDSGQMVYNGRRADSSDD